MSEEKQLGRRGFLGLATWTIGGVIGVAMGVPAIAYVLGPALQRRQAQNWIALGSTAKVEVGTPTLFRAKVQRTAGWIESEEEITAFVLTEDGRDFIALSNICTHLGCRVRWISERGEFFCPCHNGVFDRQGNVIGGPPPRPLDRFQVKVEDGQIYVLGG